MVWEMFGDFLISATKMEEVSKGYLLGIGMMPLWYILSNSFITRPFF